MPLGRPPKLTPELKSKIADCFLVAFTDQQTADFVGLNEKTIRRMRAADLCPEIKYAELQREMVYRKKIWAARGYWQGAAWFLERKYPLQFSKPEVQLQINNNTQVTNNSLIVSVEVGEAIVNRTKAANAKVIELFKDRKSKNGHSPPEAKE